MIRVPGRIPRPANSEFPRTRAIQRKQLEDASGSDAGYRVSGVIITRRQTWSLPGRSGGRQCLLLVPS